ncbi:CDP-glucose 4,6-dehydratase [Burkholderiales bacterium 8X]|nr:CDP-glucose 4,6-dehydratase [Burkholderiales bacterium 8X]
MTEPLAFEQALAARKVFVTGHTGFTGGWACLWLRAIGADVAGYSLAPETSPSLFEAADIGADLHASTIGDICDFDGLSAAMRAFEPEVVLHLAAQPLVRRSYREPVRTFEVNAQGTAHVLEAARQTPSVRGVVCVTTDKVYRNNEWSWPYRENDPLGGKDPYSASKAAAEMVIQSYVASFPSEKGKGPAIATARGGNIVGGGDWSEDRLIPDFVRSIVQGGKLTLRYPEATRPWQHVLALVHGYLMLMAKLLGPEAHEFARAWNLGPQDIRHYPVSEVLELMSSEWRRPELEFMDQPLPEAGALALDSTIARNLLGWQPAWDTQQVIRETAAWYRNYYAAPDTAKAFTLEQIKAWRRDIAA